jgi:hypothetical protein
MLYKYYQSIYQAFISASNPGNFAIFAAIHRA